MMPPRFRGCAGDPALHCCHVSATACNLAAAEQALNDILSQLPPNDENAIQAVFERAKPPTATSERWKQRWPNTRGPSSSDPNNVRAHVALWQLLLRSDRHKLDAAMPEYEKALELDLEICWSAQRFRQRLLRPAQAGCGDGRVPEGHRTRPDVGGAAQQYGQWRMLHDQHKLDGAETAMTSSRPSNSKPEIVRCHTPIWEPSSTTSTSEMPLWPNTKKAIELDRNMRCHTRNLGDARSSTTSTSWIQRWPNTERRSSSTRSPRCHTPIWATSSTTTSTSRIRRPSPGIPKAMEDFEPTKSALVHGNLGNVFYDQHKQDPAMAEYQKTIELDPKLAAACTTMSGSAYKGSTNWTRPAKYVCLMAASSLPDDPDYAARARAKSIR